MLAYSPPPLSLIIIVVIAEVLRKLFQEFSRLLFVIGGKFVDGVWSLVHVVEFRVGVGVVLVLGD